MRLVSAWLGWRWWWWWWWSGGAERSPVVSRPGFRLPRIASSSVYGRIRRQDGVPRNGTERARDAQPSVTSRAARARVVSPWPGPAPFRRWQLPFRRGPPPFRRGASARPAPSGASERPVPVRTEHATFETSAALARPSAGRRRTGLFSRIRLPLWFPQRGGLGLGGTMCRREEYAGPSIGVEERVCRGCAVGATFGCKRMVRRPPTRTREDRIRLRCFVTTHHACT